ncbi:MAG: hypothetical protein JOY61_16180 [Chloroflexi bacterium]|nr:hypothetical protein [Chloroflexota bacterium]
MRGLFRRVGQRRHAPRNLADDPEALATGGHDAQVGARAQQIGDELCTRREQVLASVQHYQQVASAQCVAERLDQRLAAALRDPQDLGYGRRHKPSIAQRGQLDEPRAVGETWQDRHRDVQRELGLAHPAGPDQGHQATFCQ